MTAQQLLKKIARAKHFKVGRQQVVVMPWDLYDEAREFLGWITRSSLKKTPEDKLSKLVYKT